MQAPRTLAPPRRPAVNAPAASGPLALPRRIAHAIWAVPDHRWLDRLVRGRAWIPVLGVLLTGIVFTQVQVLKLGAGIGRAANLVTELQSRHELLQAEVASLSSSRRIERLATQMGMVLPGPTEVSFVAARPPAGVHRALSSIHTPNSSSFLTALAAEQAANGDATTATTPVSTTPSATTPTAGTAGTTAATSTTPASTTTPPAGTTTPPAGTTTPPAGTTAPATGATAATASPTTTGAPSSTGAIAVGSTQPSNTGGGAGLPAQ